MTQEIMQNLQDGVVTIVIAIIGLLVSYAIVYINKLKTKLQNEIEKIDDEATKKLANQTLNRIKDLAITTVYALEQEYGKAIRDSIANNDGEFTRDDLVALHQKAVDSIVNQLNDEAINAVNSEINDVREYIGLKVSEAVLNFKTGMSTGLIEQIEYVGQVDVKESIGE